MNASKRHKSEVWKKAPLAYVVAEIAISPYYTLGTLIPAIQQKLRSAFPRTVEGTEHELQFGIGLSSGVGSANTAVSPRPFWTLTTAENTRAVNLNPKGISFHATEYEDSADFLRRLSEIFEALQEAQFDGFVERTGLRYVDLIVPSGKSRARDFCQSSIIGPEIGPDENVLHNLWTRNIEKKGMSVRATVATPAPPGVLLPPNLTVLQLRDSRPLEEAKTRAKGGGDTGWIDIDVSRQPTEQFEAEKVSIAFRELKSMVRDTFDGLVSDYAIGEWE